MRKNPNEKFVKELEEVKKKLPSRYMGMVDALYPGKFKSTKVYGVIHYGVENYEVLRALQAVVRRREKTKKILA